MPLVGREVDCLEGERVTGLCDLTRSAATGFGRSHVRTGRPQTTHGTTSLVTSASYFQQDSARRIGATLRS